MKRIVVGITGSTGSIYGIRLLEVLGRTAGVETHLVISAPGKRTLVEETTWSVKAVEKLAEVNVVALDKTGTLTTGELRVEKVESFPAGREAEIGQFAYSLDRLSTHPLARAVARA